MIRNITTNSTFANLAAGAALVAAVVGGGTAVATGLANNSVESRHIKDATIRSVDLANRSVTGADVDEGTLGAVPVAEAADRALTAGHAESTGRLLGLTRAKVSATGRLLSDGSGAVSAAQTSRPGRYVVTLDGPSLGCFLVTSVARHGTTPVAGSASAWFTPPLQETFGRKVTVETHAPDGDSVPDSLPFSLLVLC